MKATDQIPFYAADGRSLGFRTLEAAERLVAGGYVKASYGRKKNLRAIWARQQDGGSPVIYSASGKDPFPAPVTARTEDETPEVSHDVPRPVTLRTDIFEYTV